MFWPDFCKQFDHSISRFTCFRCNGYSMTDQSVWSTTKYLQKATGIIFIYLRYFWKTPAHFPLSQRMKPAKQFTRQNWPLSIVRSLARELQRLTEKSRRSNFLSIRCLLRPVCRLQVMPWWSHCHHRRCRDSSSNRLKQNDLVRTKSLFLMESVKLMLFTCLRRRSCDQLMARLLRWRNDRVFLVHECSYVNGVRKSIVQKFG